MNVIESRTDTNSDEYKARYEHMEKLVAELNEELRNGSSPWHSCSRRRG